MVRHRSPNGFSYRMVLSRMAGKLYKDKTAGTPTDPFITKYSKEWINVNEVEMSSTKVALAVIAMDKIL